MVFDESLLLANSNPFIAQCGYFAACKIIFEYALDDTLKFVIFTSLKTVQSDAVISAKICVQSKINLILWKLEKKFLLN